MKKLILYPALFILLFLVAYKIAVDSVRPEKISRTKILMGTVVDIQVRNGDEEAASAAMEAAFNEIKRVEVIFSSMDKEGYIYNINESADSVIPTMGELNTILQASKQLNHLTKGAFDISLQNLIELWGFEKKPVLPTEADIKNALMSAGWDNLEIQNENIVKRNNVRLNFGAIAKGYAVDRAVDVLLKHGMTDALVDAGGEIKTTGGDWRVGVQDPDGIDRLLYILDLKGKSVATSGDYEQYLEKDGKKYHHILNPFTGYPGDKCKSVTIISDENYFADGLATGVFIMGPEEGLVLVEQIEGTEALIIDNQGKTWLSSGFNNYLIR
jgi:FAD:protein FMN transferase